MTLEVPSWAAAVATELPYPLVFATVSGAHLYGFAAVERTGRLKPALYTLRVLLTGAHLMRTGLLETDLNVLGAGLPYVPDLIALKRQAEHGPLPATARADLDRDLPRLRADLEAARDASPLPLHAAPSVVEDLHDLVVRARLATVS